MYYPLFLDDGSQHVYMGRSAANIASAYLVDKREGPFVYQSMSSVYGRGGRIEGELQFIPAIFATVVLGHPL